MQQITLNLDERLAEGYETCREFVAYRAHHQGRFLKTIAADMDLSPSHFSKKLSGGDTKDKSRFTLDDLEKFVQVTGDLQPILYLVEKYLVDDDDEVDRLKRRIAELEQNKKLKAVE